MNTAGTFSTPASSKWGMVMMALVAIMLVLGLAVVLPQSTNPPPTTGGKGCPEVVLADFVIDVMMYGGVNGTPSYFTVYKRGTDYNLAGALYSLSPGGYEALGSTKSPTWMTYVNVKQGTKGVSASELLRAGDLFIKSLRSMGVTQYREIKDINNYSYSSYKSCGEIIKNPIVIKELFEDGSLRTVQYWGFIIK